ncbi:methyl-accepting chemotaxis protein [Rhodobacter capsulatus]|uniref:methyl-accepting chemotaxis protein n=1 Tax=Rhodobacter capsulatus TaxID=1061 RepID=UPI00402A1BA5
MKNPLKSVSGKLGLVAGLAISLIVLGYTAYSGWKTSVRVEAQVMAEATGKAQFASGEVARQMTEAVAAAEALNGMVTGLMQTGKADTSQIIAMLQNVPMRYDNLFSSWMSAIPGGVTDSYLTGAEGRNAAGEFSPYWTKDGQGGLTFQTFPIDPKEMWFDIPTKTGKSLTTEPYLTQQGYIVTSISVPMQIEGKTVGLIGVDITLAEMTKMMAAMETFEGGQMMLVDAAGKWIATPDPALFTKPYEGVGADLLTAALADGQPRVIEGFEDGRRRLIYPFSAKGMNATWATVLDVPGAVFSAPVRHEVLSTTLGGIAMLVMTLGAIYLAASALVQRPLGRMLTAVNGLAAGIYDKAVPGVERRDEIGTMAASVETLRHVLADKSRLEAEQDRLRAEAETERRQREAEAARMAEEREAARLAEMDRERREAAAAEELRRSEEAQRQARAVEQSTVVDSLASGLRDLARGHLDVEIATRFPEAYEQLRTDFNETASRLAEVMGSIDAATRSITGGVEEITGATTDLSRQAETSAATLEETAAALNELTASVQSAAQSARRVDSLVRGATEKARTTTQVVEDTVTAMGAIQTSSEQISKIITVIDDIAFQTNLLALNAGVEAARAGEAGRGFAVVASEVRALAQRASEAAREIGALISSSGEQVTNGVTLVGRAGEALSAIVESVETIATHVGEIASSANEQAAGIGEISSAMNQLDRTQQHNAAAYEETAAACMTLSGQTRGLRELVSQFRIAAAAQGGAPRADAA